MHEVTDGKSYKSGSTREPESVKIRPEYPSMNKPAQALAKEYLRKRISAEDEAPSQQQ
jgi:hypothetical protein